MKTLLITLALCWASLLQAQDSKISIVYFASDQAEPFNDLSTVFQDLNQLKEKYRINRIHVKGHTDSEGSSYYNQRLSERRVETVSRYLTAQGFSNTLIQKQGFGEEKPAVDNSTEKRKQLNRRVEVEIEFEQIKSTLTANKKPQKTQSTVDQAVEDRLLVSESRTEVAESSASPLIALAPAKQKLPEDAQPPIEGCRAFFSGILVSDTNRNGWTSIIFQEDMYSEYVGSGSYTHNNKAFPKATRTSFDGLAIGAGTRVVIYSKPNFQGKVLLDVTGPVTINNSAYQTAEEKNFLHDYKPAELQTLFPQGKREWSGTNMHLWPNGSMKISCSGK